MVALKKKSERNLELNSARCRNIVMKNKTIGKKELSIVSEGAGAIQKNEKTVSKKRLKNITLVVATVVLVFAACKKDEEKPNNPVNNPTNEEASVVEVKDLGNSNIAKVKAYMVFFGELGYEEEYFLAECSYQNGGFKLTLPPVIPDKCLFSPTSSWWFDENFEISDTNARTSEVVYIHAYSRNERGSIGNFNLTNDMPNNIVGFRMYADCDFTIKGSSSVEWNASFKKGWNILYISHGEFIRTYTTEKPSGIKWTYEPNNVPAIRYKKENPSTKCAWIGISHYYEENTVSDIAEFLHYFGTTLGVSNYKNISPNYHWDIVYSKPHKKISFEIPNN